MNDLHFNKSELNIILMALRKLKNEIYTSKYTFIKELYSISEEYCGKCKVAFGIGTYLTNDTKVGPLNIVMKVTECNSSDVAKLSDAAGKGMCKSEEYIEHLREQIKWRMK